MSSKRGIMHGLTKKECCCCAFNSAKIKTKRSQHALSRKRKPEAGIGVSYGMAVLLFCEGYGSPIGIIQGWMIYPM